MTSLTNIARSTATVTNQSVAMSLGKTIGDRTFDEVGTKTFDEVGTYTFDTTYPPFTNISRNTGTVTNETKH